jgi:hypothetical protein
MEKPITNPMSNIGTTKRRATATSSGFQMIMLIAVVSMYASGSFNSMKDVNDYL